MMSEELASYNFLDAVCRVVLAMVLIAFAVTEFCKFYVSP